MRFFRRKKAMSSSETGLIFAFMAIGLIHTLPELTSAYTKAVTQSTTRIGAAARQVSYLPEKPIAPTTTAPTQPKPPTIQPASVEASIAAPTPAPTAQPQMASSCLEIKQRNSAASNGFYQIDIDGAGETAPFYVECDMETNGGGWTKIIRSKHTSLADLRNFNPVFNNIGRYRSRNRGVSWGGFVHGPAQWNSNSYSSISFPVKFTEVLITVSGKHDQPYGGMGRLALTSNGNHIFSLTDPYSSWHGGQNLAVNGQFKQYRIRRNFRNYTEIIPHSGQGLTVKMSAYTNWFPHTRRFIRQLWYR